jgi:hypothetical protein
VGSYQTEKTENLENKQSVKGEKKSQYAKDREHSYIYEWNEIRFERSV